MYKMIFLVFVVLFGSGLQINAQENCNVNNPLTVNEFRGRIFYENNLSLFSLKLAGISISESKTVTPEIEIMPDDNGKFEFKNLKPGKYYFSIESLVGNVDDIEFEIIPKNDKKIDDNQIEIVLTGNDSPCRIRTLKDFKQISLAGSPAVQEWNDISEITLERKGCFGSCPRDKITFYKDGTVIYEGKMFVNNVGMFQGEFWGFEKLAELVYKQGFFNMDERYSIPITDLNTDIISVKRNKENKSVEIYGNSAPVELWAIKLAIEGLSSSIKMTSYQAQTALKKTFKNDFLIGASLNTSQFYEKDKRALPIIRTHFNTISPENVLKWESVHPRLNRYNFKDADRFVEFGKKNGMFIIGHTLVWHNQTPKEVFEDKKGNPVSREVLLERMREHIQTVVGRYKGKIGGWDVVNEAVNDDGTMRQTPWLKIIGEDYIEKAFEFAHEADPQAELYYNDYSVELEPKRKGILKLVKNLLDKGVPIKAVGLQGHNNLTFPTAEQQDETIKDFAKLGLKVMITELDISVLPDPEGFSGAEVTLDFQMKEKLDPYKNGLPPEIQKAQADRYAELFRVYLENRRHITRVTFWNVTDRESWLNNFPVRGRTNYPLLFDRDGNAKPIVERLAELRRTFLPASNE